MIITDQSIFLHFPKTGGIFVADMLKRIHANRRPSSPIPSQCEELKLPTLKRVHGEKVINIHGTYEQIAHICKDKPIITCVRNPFDLYVSTYEYRAWVDLQKSQPEIKERFPAFPDLSLPTSFAASTVLVSRIGYTMNSRHLILGS